MPYFDLPPGPELAHRNRRVLAERTRWPAGALEACEQLEAKDPFWSISWSPGGGLTWTEPGFYALATDWHWNDGVPRWVYGRTAGELQVALGDIEPRRRSALQASADYWSKH